MGFGSGFGADLPEHGGGDSPRNAGRQAELVALASGRVSPLVLVRVRVRVRPSVLVRVRVRVSPLVLVRVRVRASPSVLVRAKLGLRRKGWGWNWGWGEG